MMERNKNIRSIKDIIRSYIEDVDPDNRLTKAKIINLWGETMGETIAKRTKKIYIIRKTLFVHLDSAIVKSELYYMRQAILEKINDKFGEGVINKIVFKWNKVFLSNTLFSETFNSQNSFSTNCCLFYTYKQLLHTRESGYLILWNSWDEIPNQVGNIRLLYWLKCQSSKSFRIANPKEQEFHLFYLFCWLKE